MRTKFNPWVYAYAKQNYNFACFGLKIKINWDVLEILWNFADPFWIIL